MCGDVCICTCKIYVQKECRYNMHTPYIHMTHTTATSFEPTYTHLAAYTCMHACMHMCVCVSPSVCPCEFTSLLSRREEETTVTGRVVPFGVLWSAAPDKDTVEEAEQMVQSMDGQFVQSLCCMGKSLHCELARPSQAAHVATTPKSAPSSVGPPVPPKGPPPGWSPPAPVPPKDPPPGFRSTPEAPPPEPAPAPKDAPAGPSEPLQDAPSQQLPRRRQQFGRSQHQQPRCLLSPLGTASHCHCHPLPQCPWAHLSPTFAPPPSSSTTSNSHPFHHPFHHHRYPTPPQPKPLTSPVPTTLILGELVEVHWGILEGDLSHPASVHTELVPRPDWAPPQKQGQQPRLRRKLRSFPPPQLHCALRGSLPPAPATHRVLLQAPFHFPPQMPQALPMPPANLSRAGRLLHAKEEHRRPPRCLQLASYAPA